MKKILFALAAVVMLAPACTQDFDDSIAPVEMQTITLDASYELPEVFTEDGTRITLDDYDQLVWEDGDQITVVYTNNGTVSSVKSSVLDGA